MHRLKSSPSHCVMVWGIRSKGLGPQKVIGHKSEIPRNGIDVGGRVWGGEDDLGEACFQPHEDK